EHLRGPPRGTHGTFTKGFSHEKVTSRSRCGGRARPGDSDGNRGRRSPRASRRAARRLLYAPRRPLQRRLLLPRFRPPPLGPPRLGPGPLPLELLGAEPAGLLLLVRPGKLLLPDQLLPVSRTPDDLPGPPGFPRGRAARVFSTY